MSTTLTNGLKLPDKGSVDWYADMQSNYTILDGAVGTIADHTTAIAGKAASSHTHTKSDVTDLLNSNFIPSANNSYDLGSSSYQWNNAYIKSLTINGVACGDILTHNVNEFVDVTSAQTITGVKTFASNIIIQSGKKVTCNLDNAFIEFNGGTTWGKGGSIVLSGQGRSNYANSVLIVTKSDTDNFQIQYQNGFLKPVQSDNSLGTSTNQWKSVYAQTYYYNGTAWGLDKQNEWTNFQRMTSNPAVWYLRNDTVTLGTAPSSNRYIGMFFEDVNGADLGYVSFQANKNSYNSIMFSLRNSDGTDTYTGALRYRASTTGAYCFFPETSECDLGISTNKWKSFNGVNPGALSLPNLDSTQYDPIDFSQWNVSLGWGNNYTPQSDGWIHVNIKDSTNCSVFVFTSIYAASAYGNGSQGLTGRVALMIPVRAGVTYTFMVKASSTSDIYSVRFFPCLGNV